MTTPHKHAALIKAWADGAVIQARVGEGEWHVCQNPYWGSNYEFRIKPEPKPDVVRYGAFTMASQKIVQMGSWRTEYDNLKFTFDGETGEPKAVELLSK